jgi:hypothetical protein
MSSLHASETRFSESGQSYVQMDVAMPRGAMIALHEATNNNNHQQ